MPLDLAAYELKGAALFRMALLQEMLDHCDDPALALVVAREAEGWIAGAGEAAMTATPRQVDESDPFGQISGPSVRWLECAGFLPDAPPSQILPATHSSFHFLARDCFWPAPLLVPAEEHPKPVAPPQSEEAAVQTEDQAEALLSDIFAEPLSPAETAFSETLLEAYGDRLFDGRDAAAASGKPEQTCLALLSTLTRKRAIHRASRGVYSTSAETARVATLAKLPGRMALKPKQKPIVAAPAPAPRLSPQPMAPRAQQAEAAPVAADPIAPATQGTDPLADIVAWMISIGEDIRPSGDIYLLNGRIRLSPETLIEAANKRRKAYELKPYSLERAA